MIYIYKITYIILLYYVPKRLGRNNIILLTPLINKLQLCILYTDNGKNA